MQASLPLMSQPGRIGRHSLKNRIVMAPMGTNFSTTDGMSTERDVQYYALRAEGGVAAIFTEAMAVSNGARAHRASLWIYHDRFIPGLARIVDAVKAHNCLIFGQLNHRGGLLRRSVLGMEPVGPSPWRNPNTGDEVRALRRDEITAIQHDFVDSARRLQRAGYDGVELHAANGYLFQQFFTPRINQRDDEYGGSLANRARFLLETVARIRDAQPDFTLLVRISCTEYAPDGYGPEEAAELAKLLEAAGVDALDLSGGTNESPHLSRFCIQPPSMPRGCLAPSAAPVCSAVTIPTLVAGRVIDPVDGEALLIASGADFVSVGRALLADPFWAAKALGAMPGAIRGCISCNVCFERLTMEQDVTCAHNPMLGTEFERPDLAEPAHAASGGGKRVLVLGAGVAGVEAAQVAAGHGHRVELWESQARPGGQMALAMAAPDKAELASIWSYRWDRLQALGVLVRTGMAATEAALRDYAPDFVVVATGARPRPLALPGVDGEAVATVSAWDALADPSLVAPGEPATIIGGGLVGLELADLLASRGARVRVVEMTAALGMAMARNNRVDLLLRLGDAGVILHTECTVQSVGGDSVTLLRQGKIETIPRDPHLFAAIGPRPANAIVATLDALRLPHAVVGDANQPGDFLSGLRDACMVGHAI